MDDPSHMSLRIALASNTAWYLYNFRGGLITELVRLGHRVVTLAPPDPFSARLADLGCDVVDLPMDNIGANPLRDLLTWRDFRHAYRQARPDVALHFTVKPVIYGTLAARLHGVPVVNTVTGLGTAFLRGGALQAAVEGLYRVTQRWPHRVIFQNPDDLGLFVDRGLVCGRKALRMPGSGVDLERFAVSPSPGRAAPVFLLIARLIWDKGVGEFVEAARILRRAYPDVRFQLLGPLGVANRAAVPRALLERWVNEGLVEYLGETDDVRPHIAYADCAVLPSYREGTPRTLLEAAAMGRPLIATDVPGCREVLEDGVTGLLCRERDPADLAAKLRRMTEMAPDLRARMGLAGRTKMERQFDQRLVIEGYLGAINEALARI
jgi:glycosyltransferase involved in cell wall biosynthesis